MAAKKPAPVARKKTVTPAQPAPRTAAVRHVVKPPAKEVEEEDETSENGETENSDPTPRRTGSRGPSLVWNGKRDKALVAAVRAGISTASDLVEVLVADENFADVVDALSTAKVTARMHKLRSLGVEIPKMERPRYVPNVASLNKGVVPPARGTVPARTSDPEPNRTGRKGSPIDDQVRRDLGEDE